MATKLFFSRACEDTADIVVRMLSLAGLRAVRSFDLRSAAALAPDCACPHHGTDQCDCQYMVFLVYDSQRNIATLAVHGHNGYSYVELVDRPAGHRDAELEMTVLQTVAAAEVETPGTTDDAVAL